MGRDSHLRLHRICIRNSFFTVLNVQGSAFLLSLVKNGDVFLIPHHEVESRLPAVVELCIVLKHLRIVIIERIFRSGAFIQDNRDKDFLFLVLQLQSNCTSRGRGES